MPKDLISIAKERAGGPHDVHAYAVFEVQTLSQRFGASSTLQEACKWNTKDRLGHAELASVMISVASTASLCAYLRDGEPWLLDYAPANSARGIMLIAELHRLRAELTLKRGALTPSRVAERKEPLATAIAILLLALDAVAPQHLVEMAHLAGLGRTNDAQGDAQLRAEELSISDDGGAKNTAKKASAPLV